MNVRTYSYPLFYHYHPYQTDNNHYNNNNNNNRYISRRGIVHPTCTGGQLLLPSVRRCILLLLLLVLVPTSFVSWIISTTTTTTIFFEQQQQQHSSCTTTGRSLVVLVDAFSPQTTTTYYQQHPKILQSQQQQQQRYSKLQKTSLVRSLFNVNNNNNNDNNRIDKGLNLLEIATKFVPQGQLVTLTSESWKFIWQRLMTELAPQDKTTGAYVRPTYNFIGEIGNGSSTSYPDEPGRYHVYTGNPCPWCHRVVLTLKLLNYETQVQRIGDSTTPGITRTIPPQIGWTILEDNPRQASRGGWIFSRSQPDRIFGGVRDLRELYTVLKPGYTGRCTAPLLVDTKTKTIISNESSNIIRILNSIRLGAITQARIDLVPPDALHLINETNEWIYRLLNNGVYRCGFSTSQQAYNQAIQDVKTGLDRCETILSKTLYLCGNTITESDVYLLPTILRMDGVYNPFFLRSNTICSVRVNYPAIQSWLQRCWSTYPAIQSSIDLPDACSSYYRQLFPLNPSGIIPPPVTPESIGLYKS